jgi:TPR repeat protein
VTSEAELRKAERLCIRDVPDECVRSADAYRAGGVVKVNRKRAAQYRNLGFKAYIRLCEINRPEACYALARMYLRGDGLKANPAYAKNLMRRVVEVCRYRKAEVCERLKQEAPMPPKPKRRRTSR